MTPLAWYYLLLGAVVIERFVELALSKRHASIMFARGAVERGLEHYPYMVALHTAFILGCALEPPLFDRRFVPQLGFPMLALVFLAQAIRWWAIATLGVFWNTRVIVIPGQFRIARGPYRWLRHPNYVAVVLEGIALPLVFSGIVTSVTFSVLNAALLYVRVRSEEGALALLRPA